MKVHEIEFRKLLFEKVKNERYIERYLSFIQKCKENNKKLSDDVYCEKHHVLPVSEYPEYKQNKNNIAILTGRQHYLAHWMLAKALKSNKLWFAFNNMRRLYKKGTIYQYARAEIAEQIGNSNRGRKMPEEMKKLVSLRFKGRTMVKYKDTETYFWTDKDDPGLLTGELVHASSGRNHSDDTKYKIGAGTRGKTAYVDQSGTVKYFNQNEVPNGYEPYISPHLRFSCCNTRWVHSPLTMEEIRLKDDEPIPDGYVTGRSEIHKPNFNHVNSTQNLTVVDVYHKQYMYIHPNEYNDAAHVIINGHKLENLIVVIHNNNVTVGYKYALKYLHSVGIYVRRDEIKSKRIKKPHRNNNPNVRQFRELNQGKQLSDIGVTVQPLPNFTMLTYYTIMNGKYYA